jgi:hypothetical protein
MTTSHFSVPLRCSAPTCAQENHLPQRAGVGLKPEHFRQIVETWPELGFFEVHAENYMVDGGPFHHYLTRIRERYPLSIHGVGLSIGGESALDSALTERLLTQMRLNTGYPEIDTVLESVIALCTDEIRQLLIDRDDKLSSQRSKNVLSDHNLETLSEIPIALDSKLVTS